MERTGNDGRKRKLAELPTPDCSHEWETVALIDEGYDSQTRISWCSRCGAIASDLCFDGREREQWSMIPSANAKLIHEDKKYE